MTAVDHVERAADNDDGADRYRASFPRMGNNPIFPCCARAARCYDRADRYHVLESGRRWDSTLADSRRVGDYDGRRLFGEVERKPTALRYPPAPSWTEHRPCFQTLEECQPFIVDGFDQLDRIALADRDHNFVGYPPIIIGQPTNPPQHFTGSANTGIDGIIQNRVIDASREIVVLHRRSVVLAIDILGHGLWHFPNINRRRVTLPVFPRVDDRNSPIGRTAWVTRMIGVPTLMREHAAPHRLGIGVFHRSARSKISPSGERRSQGRLAFRKLRITHGH